jgi:hypothetical protein
VRSFNADRVHSRRSHGVCSCPPLPVADVRPRRLLPAVVCAARVFHVPAAHTPTARILCVVPPVILCPAPSHHVLLSMFCVLWYVACVCWQGRVLLDAGHVLPARVLPAVQPREAVHHVVRGCCRAARRRYVRARTPLPPRAAGGLSTCPHPTATHLTSSFCEAPAEQCGTR